VRLGQIVFTSHVPSIFPLIPVGLLWLLGLLAMAIKHIGLPHAPHNPLQYQTV
jgi:hypothetical protein